MDKIENVLRSGVKNIISQYSPVSSPGDCRLFQSSTHSMRELCFVVNGHSRYMLNGSVYESAPGTVFLIDDWVPHAFGYTKDDHNLLHLWIQLYGSGMYAGIVRIHHYGEYRLNSRRIVFSEGFGAILTKRWDLLDSQKEITPETVIRYMTAPLNAILDEAALQFFKPESETDTSVGSVIEALKKHILMMNARDCSFRKLEQISGYSRFYLAHRFRQCTGLTVGEYIERVRVEYTAAAFRRGLKQKEIAFELGFSSPANFWSWLQKHRVAVQLEEQRLTKG